MANTATAAEPITDGHIYGSGQSGTYDPITSFTLSFPQDQAPFVDVAVTGGSGVQHTTLGVTAAGAVVAQGNSGGLVSLMPASLRTKHVTAVEINNGRAAAVTDVGEIVTWANAPTAPAPYRNPTIPTGVVDVQLGGLTPDVAFGVLLKSDGTIESWGRAGFAANTPDISGVVQIDANDNFAVARTADGKLHFWDHNQANLVPLNFDEVADATVIDVALNGNSIGYALTDGGEVLAFGGYLEDGVPDDLQFPAAQAGSSVVALASNNGVAGQVALKEDGEFVAWGFSTAAANELMTPPAVDLEGHQIVSMETSYLTHTAMIFGPADPEPEPGIVSAPRIEGLPVVDTSVTGTPATFNFETSSETNAWYRAPAADTPAAEWTLIGEANPLELTASLQGQYVAFRTTVEDADGATWTADSALLGPVDAAPSGIAEAPSIEGVPVLNSEVIGIGATFTFTPESETSAWYRAASPDTAPEDWELVSDANPLTLGGENEGQYLVFRTTAVDDAGETVVADSEPLGPIVQFSGTATAIQGEPLVGSTITGVPATFTYPPETIRYFWLVGGTTVINVPDGGSLDLVLTAEDAGKTIMFFTQGTAGGQTATPFSPSFGPVTMPPLTVADAPTVEGVPVLNSEVIGIPGTFNRTPESESSAWYRAASPDAAPEDWELASEANPLTLGADDEGQYLVFRTTGVDENGAEVIADSEPLGPIVQFSATPGTITGDLLVGSTVTGVPGEFSYPPDSVIYAFLIGSRYVAIPPGGAPEVTLTEADLGETVRFFATGNVAGQFANSSADSSGPVVMPPFALVGQPTVTGQPFIGETLTATPIEVGDGIESSLQWFAGTGDEFTAIDGATGTTLELAEALRDQQVKVVQTATRTIDDASDSAESAPTAAVTDAPVDLEVTTEATLTGTPRVGQTLTGTPATFSTDRDVTVTNYWVIGGTQVEATGTTLALTDEHVGQNIQFRSIAVRGDESVPSTSATVGPVLVVLAATGNPVIGGTARVGSDLTVAQPATFSDTEGVTIGYRWLADGVEVGTGTSLRLTADHLGAEITVEATATRGDDTATATSEPTAAVEPKALGITSVPTIAGTAQVGQTLTGTPAVFDDDTATVTNQWFANGVAIDGATGTTLVLTADLARQQITFVSTATRGGDTLESASAATAVVAPPTPEGEGEGAISLPATVQRGQTVPVTIGQQYAGQAADVWLFSTPQVIGAGTVGADGRLSATIPADAELGAHRVAAYDANGNLIGWQAVTVVAADGSTGGGSGTGGGGLLPRTGLEATLMAVPIAVLLMVAGGVAVAVGRRRHAG